LPGVAHRAGYEPRLPTVTLRVAAVRSFARSTVADCPRVARTCRPACLYGSGCLEEASSFDYGQEIAASSIRNVVDETGPSFGATNVAYSVAPPALDA